MSLSSLLLTNATNGGQTNVDTALDELFRSHSVKPVTSTPESQSTSNLAGAKRKREAAEVLKAAPSSPGPAVPSRKASKHKNVDMTSGKLRSVPKEVVDGNERIVKGDDRASGSDSDNDDLLETTYLAKKTRPKQNTNPEVLRHETSSSNPAETRDHPRKKVKYTPPDETPAQRDSRTIFVGNIPIIVAKSKSHQKHLKRHVLSYVADAKIESLRFRSVAFASATAPIPVEDGKPTSSSTASTSTKQQRQKERAAAWREAGAESPSKEDSQKRRNGQKFLTSAEKKRVAFIKGDFHKEVDTVNAYIVFAHGPPQSVEDVLHPAEAAHLAVTRCDGSVFLERTLRVDHVGHKPGAERGDGGGRPADVGESRATLFVGNLDFAAREEDLRVWFEGVVGQVLGPRQGGGGDGEEVGEEEKRWVQSVRIVRDRDTQLGKGFAYVRFADQECVDEVLALDRDSLKFAKRKLRVQRCKVNSAAASKPKSSAVHVSSTVRKPTTRVKPEPVSVPAGDPSLGEKLAGLSKEERKATKAANAERVQRRLAKKKARMNVERDLAQRRSRVRDRRRRNDDKDGRSKPAKKARTRSLNSLAKKNTKK